MISPSRSDRLALPGTPYARLSVNVPPASEATRKREEEIIAAIYRPVQRLARTKRMSPNEASIRPTFSPQTAQPGIVLGT